VNPIRHPRLFPRSPRYTVIVNGQPQEVLQATGADFIIAEGDGPSDVVVEVADTSMANPEGGSAEPCVRPLARQVECRKEGGTLSFTVPGPGNYHLDLSREHPLYLFLHKPEAAPPPSGKAKGHYFCGGQVHEIGKLELRDGETVYLEAGAVVRGAIEARGVRDITIAGHGILDNSYFNRPGEATYPVLVEDSVNVTLRDLTMIEPTRWTCLLRNCEHIQVDNLRQITVGGGRDGLDLVSCRHAVVRNCFIRAGDDCIVVKAHSGKVGQPGPGKDSFDILVEGCSLLNDGGGSALEIGHELRTDSVRDITFRDCDILHVHGMGAAISINNGGQALVENIRYEDIRIEHYYDNLFWIRVIESRYSGTPQRGHIRNITFRDIAVLESIYNPGYSISVIGGFDPEHRVEDVRFENLSINGRRITDLHEMDGFVRDTGAITFS
jgi:hypothetical protein